MRGFVMDNSDFKEICDLQIEDYGYGRCRVSMTVIGKDNKELETKQWERKSRSCWIGGT